MNEPVVPNDPILSPESAQSPDSYIQGEATTLLDLLGQLDESGFSGQFDERNGEARCLACRRTMDPRLLAVRALRRLEGASDPSDMLVVAAVVCPCCGVAGSLILNYGPEATPGESDLLLGLPDASGQEQWPPVLSNP